jgi:cytochrome b561
MFLAAFIASLAATMTNWSNVFFLEDPKRRPEVGLWPGAARFVHLSSYGLLIALPMTGYLMSSADGIPVSFFGLFMLPDLVHRDDDLFLRYVTLHK